MTITVNGKEYRIKYGYKALAMSGIMNDVMSMSEIGADSDPSELVSKLMSIVPRMLLAGLQKYNTEFTCDYESAKDVKAKMNMVYDLLDDYTESNEEASILDLFTLLTNELMNNGFLSAKGQLMMEEAEKNLQ